MDVLICIHVLNFFIWQHRGNIYAFHSKRLFSKNQWIWLIFVCF